MGDIGAILIVDDDPIIRKFLNDLLIQQGYSCEVASDANNALCLLSRSTFNLALLDIKMPDMSGIDLLEVMAIGYPSIPVIMSTAVNDVNTAVEAMKKGAADYILKPFSIEDVCERIARALSENRSSKSPINCSIDCQAAPPISRMDAVAYEVEALVDHFDFHDQVVTERTVEVARKLQIPAGDIEAWVTNRQERSLVREKRLDWISEILG